MVDVLADVDRRTNLVGENRLELLLFRLCSQQTFAINVFKIREVINGPEVNRLPDAHPNVIGVAHLRGQTIPIVDLSKAVGLPPIENVESAYCIIAEFNQVTQGFLVASVEHIINVDWQDVTPPPKGTGTATYLTAVTTQEDELIGIVDVERVLSEISPTEIEVNDSSKHSESAKPLLPPSVLVVDDSAVARKQIERTLEKIDVQVEFAVNGQEGLDKLLDVIAQGGSVTEQYGAVISDIEMPFMDGYALTRAIKSHAQMADLQIIIHSSISGSFNERAALKTGADQFIPKFHPKKLGAVLSHLIWGTPELEDS
ncbi:MAG TPA: chemotaxis protein CheW [Gammaproteobacteria bacterium]|nr:chemotaxis protein CheW [Gammaproteobacteria bacterium]